MADDTSHPGQSTLPERTALRNDDDEAISIANSAVKGWNDARRAEVAINKQLLDENVQNRMANEIFMAVMAHLNTIPLAVKAKVITKFHEIPVPNVNKRVITL